MILNKISAFLKHHLFLIVLTLITIIVCVLNFTPNTYLTGWDTLHNEFDFGLSFVRNLTGIWREYQGLGAVAGHAEASDLPRQFFMWILSFVFPNNFLRYSYVFLTLILGPIGAYAFVYKLVIKDEAQNLKRSFIAFTAGLFYLFNLATVQLFYVPFEMFQTQYAFLPWLLLAVTQFMESGKLKYYLWFSVFTLLALPMAYAAALFFAYIGALVIYIGILSIRRHKTAIFVQVKRALLILVATFAINAYWFIPNVYFVVKHGANVPEAIINKSFSDEAFAYNEKFGSLPDVLILKNFLFDWKAYVGDGKFGDLLSVWNQHLANPVVLTIGFVEFAFVFIGIICAIKRKSKFALALLSVMLLALFMLINRNFPSGWLFDIFIRFFGFLQEAFRFVFNKFAVIALLSYVIFFAYGVMALFKLIKYKYLQIVFGTIITGAILIFGYPSFKGELIGNIMRIQIPDEYFSLNQWFKEKPVNGRIAKLPIQSYAGWSYYDWNYQGSGFIWFGIEAPMLDRDFDRWIPYNEQYYWEINRAVYARDLKQFRELIQKYQIEYLLVDLSVIEPGSSGRPLMLNDIKMLIDNLGFVREEVKFGDVRVFHLNLPEKVTSFISSPNSTSAIGLNGVKNHWDIVYDANGNYIDLENENTTNYPYSTLYGDSVDKSVDDDGYHFKSNIKPLDQLVIPSFLNNSSYIPIDIYASEDEVQTRFKFKFQLPQVILNGKEIKYEFGSYSHTLVGIDFTGIVINEADNYSINNNNLNSENEIYIGSSRLSLLKTNSLRVTGGEAVNTTFTISKSDLASSLSSSDYLVPLNGEATNRAEIDVVVPMHAGYLSKTFSAEKLMQGSDKKSCGGEKPNQYQSFDKELLTDNDFAYIRYSAVNNSCCDSAGFWEFGQDSGYILDIKQRNISGFPLYVCIANYNSDKCDQRFKLENTKSWTNALTIVPPMNSADSGYGVSLDNLSFNYTPSVNDVESINMQAIPYEWLSRIRTEANEKTTFPSANILTVSHPIPSFYSITIIPKDEESLLALNQSYEENWIALGFDNNGFYGILPHHIYNNWANGYLVPQKTEKVIILFTPQLYVLTGFIFLVTFFGLLGIKIVRNKL